jgi:hypothetical protein
MPSAIVETPVQGTPIDAPLDADLRNAASVRVPFQATGNRLNWLEAFVKRIGGIATDLITTALLIPAGNLTLRLTGGNLIFDGNDDYNVYLGGIGGTPGGVQLFANGNMAGQMFTKGRTGRANRKPNATLTGAGPFDIRPDLYDTYQVSASGACVINIDPAGTYAEGDSFRVVNLATSNGYTIAIKSGGGAVTHYVIGNGFTNAGGYVRPNVVELMRTGAGGWTVILGDSLA